MKENFKYSSMSGKATVTYIIIAVIAIAIVSIGAFSVNKFLNKDNDNKSAKNENSNSTSQTDESNFSTGVDENAKSFIEYKDNTRDLAYNPENGLINIKYKTYYNFSFYLNKDESQVLSYKWDDTYEKAYDFVGIKLDDENKCYVYQFSSPDGEEVFFITSPKITKSSNSKIDFTEKTEEQVNGKTLYVGKFNSRYNLYQYNVKKGNIEVALLYANGKNNASDALANIETFSKCVVSDNSSPFVIDYLITNKPIGDVEKTNQSMYIKSYKLVKEVGNLSSTGSLINASLGLNYTLENKGIEYKYSQNYMLLTDEYETYDSYKTENPILNANMYSAYIPIDDVFAITISLGTGLRYGFVVSNANTEFGEKYYIDNFTEMFVTPNGNGFGATIKYEG